MQPITLDLEKVKTAALAYYNAGKLTAQHPNIADRQCVYFRGEYRCAIGAALDAKDANSLPIEGGSVGCLIDRGTFLVDAGEYDDLVEIQQAHDRWADEANHPEASGKDSILAAEQAFLKLLR